VTGAATTGWLAPPPADPGAVIRMEHEGGTAVLRVEGDLDIGTTDLLGDGLRTALALARGLLVVDLEACPFVGVQPFQQIERAARVLHGRGGRLSVRLPPPSFLLIRDHAPPGLALVTTGPASR